jgi:hypothetical protein
MVKKTRKTSGSNKKNITKKKYANGGGGDDPLNGLVNLQKNLAGDKELTVKSVSETLQKTPQIAKAKEEAMSKANDAVMTAIKSNPHAYAAYTGYRAAKFVSKYAPPLTVDMPPDEDYPQVDELRDIILYELLEHPNFAPISKDTPDDGILEHTLANSKLCQIIEDHLKCDHTHTLLVNTFIEFIEKKVLSSHYHSKTEENDKFINSMDIFYRHGLSKIISKIFEEITTDEKALKSFLQELEGRFLKMKDEDLIEVLMRQDLLFELMDDDHITNLSKGMDESQLGALMIELYNKEEFDELLTQVELNPEEINTWKKKYEYYLDIKKEEDAEKRNDIVEKIKNNLFTPPESNQEKYIYVEIPDLS